MNWEEGSNDGNSGGSIRMWKRAAVQTVQGADSVQTLYAILDVGIAGL